MAISRLSRLLKVHYDETPGLNLTLGQASKLLNADGSVCLLVLGRLVEMSFLICTSDGRYLRTG